MDGPRAGQSLLTGFQKERKKRAGLKLLYPKLNTCFASWNCIRQVLQVCLECCDIVSFYSMDLKSCTIFQTCYTNTDFVENHNAIEVIWNGDYPKLWTENSTYPSASASPSCQLQINSWHKVLTKPLPSHTPTCHICMSKFYLCPKKTHPFWASSFLVKQTDRPPRDGKGVAAAGCRLQARGLIDLASLNKVRESLTCQWSTPVLMPLMVN